MLPSHKHTDVKHIVETDVSVFGPMSLLVVLRMAIAETLGTAMLVILGCAGGVVGLPGTPADPLVQCLIWGFVIMIIIQSVGHISKCHINPAVTVALLIFGDISFPLAAVYIVCQCVGGTIGYGILMIVLPTHLPVNVNNDGLCVCQPAPQLKLYQAVLVEMIITGTLVFVVCGVFDWRNAIKTDAVPLKFGVAVAGLALLGAPFTSAAMNPARALAPVIWTGIWKHHWIYWIGPMCGSIICATFYRFVFKIPLPKEVVERESEIEISITSGEDEEEETPK